MTWKEGDAVLPETQAALPIAQTKSKQAHTVSTNTQSPSPLQGLVVWEAIWLLSPWSKVFWRE
jgi:hypothetical protein